MKSLRDFTFIETALFCWGITFSIWLGFEIYRNLAQEPIAEDVIAFTNDSRVVGADEDSIKLSFFIGNRIVRPDTSEIDTMFFPLTPRAKFTVRSPTFTQKTLKVWNPALQDSVVWKVWFDDFPPVDTLTLHTGVKKYDDLNPKD